MDDYGLALKNLRKHFGVTQSALADKIGVSKHAISKWENGVNQPDLQTVRSICSVFNISTEDFFRIASGEDVKAVLNGKTSKSPKGKINKSTVIKLVTLIILPVIAISVCVGCIIGSKGDGSDKRESDDESLPSISESIELGDPISGTKEEFLLDINSSIALKDGVSEYDLFASLSAKEKVVNATSMKIAVDKKSGAIVRFFVSFPSENLEAYTDFEYIYTTKYGEKLRLENTAYDLLKYIEDIEEPYSLNELTSLKAYKKGYSTQYVFSFSEEYATEELKDFTEELNGVIITDCKGVFVKTSGGSTEKVTVNFIYEGNEFIFEASRQFKSSSDFTFPDFSEYIEPADTQTAIGEIESAVRNTKGMNAYSKTVFSGEKEIYNFRYSGGISPQAQGSLYGEAVYYKDGKIYSYSSDYEGSFPYRKKISYGEFYQTVTKDFKYNSLLNLNFALEKDHVLCVIKKQTDGEKEYNFYLSQSGIEYLKETIGVYLYVYGDVTARFKTQKGRVTYLSITDKDNRSLSLEISEEPQLNIPDLSGYKPIIDGTNEITGVKNSQFSEYELDYETAVDYQTGEIYLLGGKTIKRYDKNHNLLKEYQITVSNGYSAGKIVGISGNCVYYTTFDGYDFDISEDNELYSLNLTTGECYRHERNYDYKKVAVAVYNGRVIHDEYRSAAYGSKLEIVGSEFSSTYFLYYDITNSILVFDGYKYSEDGSKIYTYDLKTDTLCVDESEGFYRNDEYLVGEGYYDPETGILHRFSEIGKTKTEKYLGVIDRHPDRDYYSPIDANWQIIKENSKYIFTTMGVYEKSSENFIYFPEKADYRFFNGGVHVWGYYRYSFSVEKKTLYTFFF